MYVSKLAEYLMQIRELKRANDDGSTARKDQVEVSLEHLKRCDLKDQNAPPSSDR